MNVELNKQYPLEHSAELAWQLLGNIEAVALCMPGAEIIEVVDENNFKGKVRVRLGPVSMEFKGDINVQSIDASEKQIHLVAEGQDNKGTSSASMDLTANIADSTDALSVLSGDAKVIVNGKMASFGQRMLAQVSDQVLEQFANNFRTKLSELEPAAGAANDAANVQSAENIVSTIADNSEVNTTEATVNAQPASSAPNGNEINGFKFILGTIRGLIAGLFKRK